MTTEMLTATCTLALASEGHADTGQTWVHLLPSGTFASRDGRGPFRAENPAAIIAASRQIAGRREIPVDYDHQIDNAPKNGQPAPAAGWISGLQQRDDGIWGLVKWTARAAQHLAAREYRYLSPVIHHLPDGQVMAITRAALVNNPALDHLTALASAETKMSWKDVTLDANALQNLGELRKLLGLPEDAAMDAILAAVRTLTTQQMSASAPNPAEYVPIGDFIRVTQELTRVHQGIEAQTAKMHVEEQVKAGRLLPFMKDWAINLCTINKPAFDDFMTKAGGAYNHLLTPSLAARVYTDPTGRSSLSDTDNHVAATLGHTPETFKKAAGN